MVERVGTASLMEMIACSNLTIAFGKSFEEYSLLVVEMHCANSIDCSEAGLNIKMFLFVTYKRFFQNRKLKWIRRTQLVLFFRDDFLGRNPLIVSKLVYVCIAYHFTNRILRLQNNISPMLYAVRNSTILHATKYAS